MGGTGRTNERTLMPPPLFRRPGARFPDVLHFFCFGAVIGLAMTLILPGNLGLWDLYPVVQMDALPGPWIMALMVCTFLTGIGVSRRHSASGRNQTVWRLALALLLGAVLVEVTLFIRAGGILPAGLATVTSDHGDLTILSFNARGTSASDIIGAVFETEADAVLLVETNSVVAAEIVSQLGRSGLDYQLFIGSGTAPGSKEQVAIIVADSLGTYHQVPAPALAFGGLTIVAEDSGGPMSGVPMLTAVHPPAPLPGGVDSTGWKQQLQTAVDACVSESAIVGGDFNASSAHIAHLMSPMCFDAGSHLGRGLIGTWPAFVPAPLGASIDHQLANGNHWKPVGIRFLNVGRSDHRGVAVSYRAADS